MEKVIFIPGFTGGKRDMVLFKAFLSNYNVIYFDYDTGLNDKIEDIAKSLKRFIDKLKLKTEKVNIVGVSAGGIIADYYLKYIDNKKVKSFVSICSPFGGTYLTYLFSKKRKGLMQLTPKCGFLKRLSSKKLRHIRKESIWCYLDPLVPGTSGKSENPKHTLFFLHWIIQWWPVLIFEAKSFLDKK